MDTVWRSNPHPILDIGGFRVLPIGDPHLGRKFQQGVPSDRWGEREKMVEEDFFYQITAHAREQRAHLVVVTGDIFNKFSVGFDVIARTARMLAAAVSQTQIPIVVLEGNHDVSKDTEAVSAFDLLTMCLQHIGNIYMVGHKSCPKGLTFNTVGKPLLFLPYAPFKTAEELAQECVYAGVEYGAIFGHWDLDAFGKQTANLCPIEFLSQHTKLIVTGHIHNRHTRRFQDTVICVTGSMQPYTHAEDDTGEWYVTLSLSELESRLSEMPKAFSGKNVRVILQEGEDLPAGVDCLSLVGKPVASLGDEIELSDMEMEAFDLAHVFQQQMGNRAVCPEIQKELLDKLIQLQETSHADS